MKLDFSQAGRPGAQAGACRLAAVRRAAGIAAAGGAFIAAAPALDSGILHAQGTAAGTYTAAKAKQAGATDSLRTCRATMQRLEETVALVDAWQNVEDPGNLQPNQAIRGIAALVMGSAGDTKGRMSLLFEYLRAGAPSGLRLVESAGRPPRTAAEAVEKGGDCTEFASVVLSAIGAMNDRGAGIRAEALIVHFGGSPENMQHMIVRVEIDGKMTIVDLQSGALGTTKKGRYDVILRLPPEQAATIYFQELGDYLSDGNAADAAIAAYRRAVEMCPANAEANRALAAKYERRRDWGNALSHYRAAAAADPACAKDTARARYYLEYGAGEAAAEAGRWTECAACFRRARGMLELHPFPAEAGASERAAVEQNIGVCERNAAKTGR